MADNNNSVPPKPRQTFQAHTIIVTRNPDGTVAINYDGVLFDTSTAPITANTLSLANNGGVAWGFDNFDFRFRNGPAIQPAANNTMTITDFSVAVVPRAAPSP